MLRYDPDQALCYGIFLCDSYARIAETLLYKFVRTNRQDLIGNCSSELSTISFDFGLSSVVRKISVDSPDIIIMGCSVTITNGAKIYIRFVICGMGVCRNFSMGANLTFSLGLSFSAC